jgi:Tol biopolymer transport system component
MKIGINLLTLTTLSCLLLAACTGVMPNVTLATESTIDMTQFNPLDPNSLVAPHGKIAFSSQVEYENHEIFVVNTDGSNLVRLTNQEGFDNDPVWSPDGSKIAFVSTRFDNWDICIMNADGSNVIRVTDNPANDFHPSWSPDGQRLVFQSNQDTQDIKYGDARDEFDIYQLYIINIDGSNLRRLTQDPYTNDWNPAWSPDGKHIVFSSQADFDQFRIEIIEPDGSNRQVLASDKNFGYNQPAWSPDGTQIAFMEISAKARNAIPNLLIMNTNGSNIHPVSKLLTPGTSPSWSADGKHIAFDSSNYDGNKYAIYIMNADGTGVKLLVEIPYSSRSASWSPR